MKDYSPEVADVEKRIKTALYELWLQDGIIYGSYPIGTIVDLELSKKVLKDRTKLSDGKAYPILGYGANVKYWTKEAKEFHSSEEYSRLIKAVALVYDSPIISIIITFYYRFYKSAFPIKSFSNEKQALKWLEQFKD